MTLKTTFQDLAHTLVTDTFKDISKPAVLKRRGPSEFDPATGEVVQGSTTQAVRAVFQDFKDEKRRVMDIQDGDIECLLARKLLKTLPQAGDQIVQNAITYDVLSVHLDAAEALYTLHLRRA